MAVWVWDYLKENDFDDYCNFVDLYGDPNQDIERFIKGRNL